MASQNSIFEEQYVKLMNIESKQSDKIPLLEILTNLNALNYNEKIPFITTWTCTDLLLHAISLLKEFGKEETYLMHLCQLIVNIASKQKVVISSMSVNVILHGLKDIWFEMLCFCTTSNMSKDSCNHLLSAVAAVVYGNGAYILPDIIHWLTGKDGKSGSVGELLSSPVSLDLKRLSLQCLSGLCIMSESREILKEEYLHYCLQLFIQTLQSIPPVKDLSHYRAIFASHKGIQYLLEGPSSIHVDEIGPLLAILKKHLVFGLATPNELPEVLTPIPIPSVINTDCTGASLSNKPRVTKKKKKKNRSKTASERETTTTQADVNKVPDQTITSDFQELQTTSYSLPSYTNKASSYKFHVPSSESEYSDTEGGLLSSLTSFALKIRQMAINSLHSIVCKTSKVLMLGYWNSFLSSFSGKNDVSLLSCILNDPAPKARVGALMVLSALLEGSKAFLVLGIQKGDSTAYVSFSSMLTSYVHNVHSTLFKAIVRERSTLVMVHILKALSILAANTPYAKLTEGFISNIFSKVRTIMGVSRDIDTRIGAINVYISLLGNDSTLPEVFNSLINKQDTTARISDSHDSSKTDSFNPLGKSWLIEESLGFFSVPSECPLPIRVALLQLLGTASKIYFKIVKNYITEITALICSSVCDDNSTVRLHASKLAEDFGSSLMRAQQSDKTLVEKGMHFWQRLLSGSLQKVIENLDDPVSKSLMCNCLSTMGPDVFDGLSSGQKIYCQTLLLGLTGDEHYLVRSASIRALAVYIMYPVLRKDIAFVEDVALCVLKLMKDQVKGVQYNAAWSFGNFTDAIIINVENDSKNFSKNMFRKPLLLNMIECANSSFDSKDKVRYNMMRVLGNIMRFCNESHVDDDRFRSLLLRSKLIIVNAVRNDPLMKVRWNACLACGNLLRNVHLPVGQSEWTDDVYNALTAAISSSKNYKVSIKAAIALGCPLSREAFGDGFTSIYICVIRALKNSETNEVDIGEYKFKDKLQEQLMYTLLHMTVFLTPEDIPIIIAIISEPSASVCIRAQVQKWYNSLFVERKYQSVTNNDADTYAALGQFTVETKKKMFETACKHWQFIFQKINNDFSSSKSSTISLESIHACDKLFTIET